MFADGVRSFCCDVITSPPPPPPQVGELSCQILDCGDISDTLDDRYATLVNDGRCILPRRWDVVGGTCTANNQWDAVAPATRAVRCGPVPAGLPQRDLYAETVDIACSPIGWARKDAAGADVAIGSTICRTDCGNTLAGARNKEGETGRVSGADFDACDGDTGVGATCQSTCLSTDGIRASFTCGADGVWQEVRQLRHWVWTSFTHLAALCHPTPHTPCLSLYFMPHAIY